MVDYLKLYLNFLLCLLSKTDSIRANIYIQKVRLKYIKLTFSYISLIIASLVCFFYSI